MQYDPIDYEAIQRRVVARVRRRYGFFFHSAIFILGIPVIGGWGSAFGFFIWVGAWITHLIWMTYQNNIERTIEREIDMEREKILKRKRDHAELDAYYETGQFRNEYDAQPEWLGDDGELHPYDYEEEY
ncbi:MAG: hypothetical protein WBC91_12570 [Phototrophicaceae bacterium]